MNDPVAAILRMPLFNGFTENGARGLIELGRVQEHAAGEPICKEGDAATGVLLVLSGTLRAYIERQGKELVVADFGPGVILGDIAVLSGIPRAASVRALDPSAVLYWSDHAFRKLILQDVFLSHRIFANSLRLLIEREKSLVESAAARATTSVASAASSC